MGSPLIPPYIRGLGTQENTDRKTTDKALLILYHHLGLSSKGKKPRLNDRRNTV
jgi:hypothetical protein